MGLLGEVERVEPRKTTQTTPKEAVKPAAPTVSKTETAGYDLEKLAVAIATAETSNCTKGTALTHNNCFGIKRNNTCTVGTPRGSFVQFSSHEESFQCFRQIWTKWYRAYPNYTLAHKWTGGDRVNTWLNNVGATYNTL